jgi:hypothetical protein
MDSQPTLTPPRFELVVALLALVLAALCLISVLCCLRRRRYRAHRLSLLPHQKYPSQHRLTMSTTSISRDTESRYFIEEKRDPTNSLSILPSSPVPEIRITFPDEDGSSSKRQCGRVVVLRIADSGAVGMEPLAKEQLPPYQPNDSGRFQSLDLERIGGLKEKEAGKNWS